MKLKKTIVRSVAAVSASALPFMLGAQPASADEAYSRSRAFEHTFTNFEDQQVTCTVGGGASLFRPSDQPAFFAEAFTQAYGDNPSCRALVDVLVTYRDVNGNAKQSGADAENFVDWFADDASREFSANHFIGFFDCQSNCEVNFTTRPK